jgi:hypothetical protein
MHLNDRLRLDPARSGAIQSVAACIDSGQTSWREESKKNEDAKTGKTAGRDSGRD